MGKAYNKKSIFRTLILCTCQVVFLFFFAELSVYAEEKLLIPVGQTVGITLDMEGVTVTNTAEVQDFDGKKYTPAKDAGIKAGDIVKKINGIHIESAAQLEALVNEQGTSPLSVVVDSHGKEKECTVNAVQSNLDGFYRMGIWIKDAASGIGTITYMNPETNEFGALGHSISENSDDSAVPILGGDVLKAKVVSIQKGTKGHPGELIGVFSEGKEKIGNITSNTSVGLKGTLDQNIDVSAIKSSMPAADRHSVQVGEAEILSNIDADTVEAFSVEIQKINDDEESSKGMIIKITDERLLEKTGGIVQGMSGSPIIQNNKLVGAVTHVFVNDPTKGYGIFIENMLDA